VSAPAVPAVASDAVMMFIDADNVSADVIEQALSLLLAEHGAVHVRRAYCSAEAAVKQAPLFKRLSIRPMVNLAVGKNCTDIALAVDAIDLVSAQPPRLAVIVSSDADFAPLVLRLREKGCRVLGIGQQGKTGEDATGVYDAFVELRHRSGGPARAAAKAAAPRRAEGRSASGRRAASASEPAAASAAATVPTIPATPATPATPAEAAPAASKKRSPRGRRAAAATPAPEPAAPAAAWPEDVERVLAALPELREGAPFELRHAAERLRAAGLLARSAPSTKLFRKYPDFFALAPQRQPNEVRFHAGAPARR
jgi:hypothetical protein